MKRFLANLVNPILAPLGCRLVSTAGGVFEMEALLQRIASHPFEIGTVIDIGASNGKWTKMAARTLDADRFLAIEALEERRADLADLGKRDVRVRYVIAAAGAEDGGAVNLSVGDGGLDGATVNSGNAVGAHRRVPVRTLDSLVEEMQLPAPYLLKFDTHGFERAILDGATSVLARSSVIVMEVYNHQLTSESLRFPEMCVFLEAAGFRCFDLVEPMLRPFDGTLWQMDMAFCRSDAPCFARETFR